MQSLVISDFTSRILVALILGTAIGIERQWRQRMAGLRTNALVSVGSALFASLACLVVNESSPTRMAAQIVSGIGFLGAGLILREGNHVRGLNTAATVWCSAAVGTLCGAGFLYYALLGTIAIILANIMLRPLAVAIANKSGTDSPEIDTVYIIKITCGKKADQHIRALLMNSVLRASCALRSVHSQELKEAGQIKIQAELVSPIREDRVVETIVSQLGIDEGIIAISWQLKATDPDPELG